MPVLLDIDSGVLDEQTAQNVLDGAEPARTAGMEVAVGGSIGSELSQPETETSEVVGNLAAMIILALVFGSLVAMGMPIVTAIVGALDRACRADRPARPRDSNPDRRARPWPR